MSGEGWRSAAEACAHCLESRTQAHTSKAMGWELQAPAKPAGREVLTHRLGQPQLCWTFPEGSSTHLQGFVSTSQFRLWPLPQLSGLTAVCLPEPERCDMKLDGPHSPARGLWRPILQFCSRFHPEGSCQNCDAPKFYAAWL